MFEVSRCTPKLLKKRDCPIIWSRVLDPLHVSLPPNLPKIISIIRLEMYAKAILSCRTVDRTERRKSSAIRGSGLVRGGSR